MAQQPKCGWGCYRGRVYYLSYDSCGPVQALQFGLWPACRLCLDARQGGEDWRSRGEDVRYPVAQPAESGAMQVGKAG